MMYNMCITWDTDCDFIFDSWHSQTAGGLTFGVMISFVVAFFSVGFSFIKTQYLSNNRIQSTVGFLVNYLIKLIIMFLIMTMNGYVNLAIIFGMTFGQLSFEYFSRVRKWKKVPKSSVASEQ